MKELNTAEGVLCALTRTLSTVFQSYGEFNLSFICLEPEEVGHDGHDADAYSNDAHIQKLPIV